MKHSNITGAVAAALLLALSLLQPARAQVNVDITGSHEGSENTCTVASLLFFNLDCTYSKQFDPGAGWAGPNGGASGSAYYVPGSAGDSFSYVPVAGDARINPAITGTLTITGTGSVATVSGTIIVGAAARNVITGQTSRAVERWDTLTHALASTPVSSATANGDGGFDYVIGSNGKPGSLCLSSDSMDCFPSETGSDASVGPAGTWNSGTPPAVGIERSTFLGGRRPNLGATTTAVFSNYSSSCPTQSTCDSGIVVWGATGATAEDPGYDNLIMAISTNAAGDITSGEAWWTQEYIVPLNPPPRPVNSYFGSRFTFTGTAQAAPGICADFSAVVVQDSTDNILDARSQCVGFDVTPTVTIVDGPSNGSASVNGSGQILYTPAGGFNGSDSITYNGDDGTDSDDGVITITVGQDTMPVSPDGGVTISTRGVAPESVTGVVNISTLPGYVQGNAPVTVSAGNGANGTVTVSGNTLTYRPDAGFFAGADSFTYSADDADEQEDEGMITVTLTDFTPVVADGEIDRSAGEDTLTLSVVPGNGSPAQHVLTVSTDASNGNCALNGFEVTYTADPGFTGSDSCVVTLTDGDGDSDTATVSIGVEGVVVIDSGGSALDLWSLGMLAGLSVLRQWRRVRALLALLAFAIALPAMAQEGQYRGFFAGAGFAGTSINSNNPANGNGQLDAAVSGEFDGFPATWQVFAGWMASPKWGAELRYSGSDKADADIYLRNSETSALEDIGDIEADISGFTFYLSGILANTGTWNLYGKLGWTVQDLDSSSFANGGPGLSGSSSVSDSDNGVAVAVGGRWRFAPRWAATVEGEMLGVDFDQSIDEPWRLGLNIEYWFGR